MLQLHAPSLMQVSMLIRSGKKPVAPEPSARVHNRGGCRISTCNTSYITLRFPYHAEQMKPPVDPHIFTCLFFTHVAHHTSTGGFVAHTHTIVFVSFTVSSQTSVVTVLSSTPETIRYTPFTPPYYYCCSRWRSHAHATTRHSLPPHSPRPIYSNYSVIMAAVVDRDGHWALRPLSLSDEQALHSLHHGGFCPK
jgi:hypothetical protein